MLKQDEATNPNSCWNKGREDECIFVLLARDEAASVAIRAWAAARVRLLKNTWDDQQIREAMECAELMDNERKRINYKPHGGGMAGHDDELLTLRPGGFYESRAGDVWCCYRIDRDDQLHAVAKCIMVSSGRLEYFFEDGKDDREGKSQHTLVRVVPPR